LINATPPRVSELLSQNWYVIVIFKGNTLRSPYFRGNIMRSSLAVFYCAVLLTLAGQAFADENLQMLPPTLPGTSTVCSGGLNQALVFTGDPTVTHSAINCMPVTIDNGGAVTTGGTVTAGQLVTGGNVQGVNLIVTGAPPIDVLGADTIYNLATLPACGANQSMIADGNGSFSCVNLLPTNCSSGVGLVSDGSGGWQCAPKGATFGGAYDEIAACGPSGCMGASCQQSNPATGGCSCPAGTSASVNMWALQSTNNGFSQIVYFDICSSN
jgi:hypothetical protein